MTSDARSHHDARALLGYGLTSVAMASAWHLEMPSGIWFGNGLAVVVGLCSAVWIAPQYGRISWRGWREQLTPGLLLGLVIAALTQLASRTLLLSIEPVRNEISRLYGLLRSPPGPALSSPILLLVILTEELVFRGVVTTWLQARLLAAPSVQTVDGSNVEIASRTVASHVKRALVIPARQPRRWFTVVVASSCLYTVPLLGSGSPLLAAIGFGLGTIWTIARLSSGGLTIPLVSHVLFSFSTFVWFPVL